MKFEIEKAKDGTFTSREVVNGKVTRYNSGVNTKQKAYQNIIGWIKRDVKRCGVAVGTFKKGNKGIHTYVSIGVCGKSGFVKVKEINC
jgi:hypothetical protein